MEATDKTFERFKTATGLLAPHEKVKVCGRVVTVPFGMHKLIKKHGNVADLFFGLGEEKNMLIWIDCINEYKGVK